MSLYIDGKTDLSSKIIAIVADGGRSKIIYHTEYDDPITLEDIARKIPEVRMVIAESLLDGVVYRYGNHEAGKWEEVGKTKGYA